MSLRSNKPSEPRKLPRRGRLIRALRLAKRWTQDDLAQATGVSRSAIAQWETDRASFQGKADLIAQALDVPLSQVTGDEPPALTHHGARALSTREAALLTDYQRLSELDQDAVERIVSRMAGQS